ncbi:MAG: hypothetical protein WCF85_22320, partial [Rhodospirillaceae bacterium]
VRERVTDAEFKGLKTALKYAGCGVAGLFIWHLIQPGSSAPRHIYQTTVEQPQAAVVQPEPVQEQPPAEDTLEAMRRQSQAFRMPSPPNPLGLAGPVFEPPAPAPVPPPAEDRVPLQRFLSAPGIWRGSPGETMSLSEYQAHPPQHWNDPRYEQTAKCLKKWEKLTPEQMESQKCWQKRADQTIPLVKAQN